MQTSSFTLCLRAYFTFVQLVISESELFLGVAGCRDTLILYYFLIRIFTDLDTILISSQWSERHGEVYMEVAVVSWFWCWLCSCWRLSGLHVPWSHCAISTPSGLLKFVPGYAISSRPLWAQAILLRNKRFLNYSMLALLNVFVLGTCQSLGFPECLLHVQVKTWIEAF